MSVTSCGKWFYLSSLHGLLFILLCAMEWNSRGRLVTLVCINLYKSNINRSTQTFDWPVINCLQIYIDHYSEVIPLNSEHWLKIYVVWFFFMIVHFSFIGCIYHSCGSNNYLVSFGWLRSKSGRRCWRNLILCQPSMW